MNPLSLRQGIETLAIGVWLVHFVGAARTFRPAPGERPSPTVHFFGLAVAVLIYKTINSPLEGRLVVPGVACFVGSLALFLWARYSVQGKFFSYLNSDDTPQFLWTKGPYAYIRNPFYASYLLSYIGAALLFPDVITVGVVVFMGLFFVSVARHEERKFQRSEMAFEYEGYRQRTGRFLPKLKRPDVS